MAKNCYNKGVKKRRGRHCSEATQKYILQTAILEHQGKECYILLMYDYATT